MLMRACTRTCCLQSAWYAKKTLETPEDRVDSCLFPQKATLQDPPMVAVDVCNDSSIGISSSTERDEGSAIREDDGGMNAVA